MVQIHITRAARKRMLYILGALLAVNAAVAHILIDQISARTRAKTQVLATEETLAHGELVTGNADTPLEAGAKPQIAVYTVQSGDTISGIAEKFNISVNTIRWANELDKKAMITVGQKLVILPITGIQYTVKKGDTLSGIAKKFSADANEILSFNDLENPNEIKQGLKLIIPDAEPIVTPPKSHTKTIKNTASATTATTQKSPQASTDTHSDTDDNHGAPSKDSGRGGYINPVPGSVLTQGLHAVNAVDMGAPTGTAVLSVKAGTVIVAKGGGAYNGGFGNFIVIDHGDGVQTLYAHLSKVSVRVGDSVDQGEQIGTVGNTGKSTGSHLHIEVHGAKNVWTKDKKGTRY